ncbi:MAG: uracil-DNA glycosylase [Sandarakinorhabdus sp.]|nr:uracil-DNA glycosylase [Sandarakinorhabdus sp.]
MHPNAANPVADCGICPRLAAHRAMLRIREPGWFNAPVPSFGDPGAWLAIVGLAPGEKGANRTGRPFTGDFAGVLLYRTLIDLGLATGHYGETPGDGLTLNGVIITNAVRCLPPANRPEPAEIRACRPFLEAQLAALPKLKVVLALGQIAHQSAVKALGGKLPRHRFAHAAVHRMHRGHVLVDSYHCSRYNQNTGRLTASMFREAFEAAIAARSGADFRSPRTQISCASRP